MNHITIIVALTFGLFLAAALASNTIVYAQQVLSSSSPSSSPLHPEGSSVKLHAVKIASPARGQQVPIGKNLTVSGVTSTLGTPTGNTANHCQVSVIANGAKPYQIAKGTGPGGAADYSTWSYVLSSKYTTMKQGPSNKITAKYSCRDNPKASYYSVNVTGIAEAMPVRTTIGKAASQNADRTSTVTTAAHALPSKNLMHLGKTVSNDYHFSNGSIKASYNNDSRSHVPNSTTVSGRILSTSSGSANATIHSNNGDTGFATNSKPARSSSYPILNPSLHSMTNELKNRIIEKLRNKDSFQIPSHIEK
jgi:hypothetical protein